MTWHSQVFISYLPFVRDRFLIDVCKIVIKHLLHTPLWDEVGWGDEKLITFCRVDTKKMACHNGSTICFNSHELHNKKVIFSILTRSYRYFSPTQQIPLDEKITTCHFIDYFMHIIFAESAQETLKHSFLSQLRSLYQCYIYYDTWS